MPFRDIRVVIPDQEDIWEVYTDRMAPENLVFELAIANVYDEKIRVVV